MTSFLLDGAHGARSDADPIAEAAAPTTCMRTNAGTEAGAMPAKVSENVRASVTAGLAKLVELVNQYAAVM